MKERDRVSLTERITTCTGDIDIDALAEVLIEMEERYEESLIIRPPRPDCGGGA